MKNIAVLVDPSRSLSGQRFVDALNKHSQNIAQIINYSDIVVSIKRGVVTFTTIAGEDIFKNIDLVYLRGITFEPLRHAAGAYLSSRGIAIVNSESHNFQTMSKLEQYVVLAIHGVPIPDSVYVGRSDHFEAIPLLLGSTFPLVAKSITGRNGDENVLVHSVDELKSLAIDQPIFQPYIENTFDYRVIVAGKEVLLAYKRIRGNDGSHKNNVSQGGRREMTEISEELEHIAISAANAVGREFTGLDILPSTDGSLNVVLEVNFNFGTPEFEDEEQEKRYYEKVDRYFIKLMDS